MKNNKPLAAKNMPFKNTKDCGESTTMLMLRRWRLLAPTNMIEVTGQLLQKKAHVEKKSKGTLSEVATNTSMETILHTIDSLGKRVDDRMEEMSRRCMLAAIAKTVQLNSEELKERTGKVKNLEKQLDILRKENDDMKGRLLNQETYKRRWCLRMKGKKEKVNE